METVSGTNASAHTMCDRYSQSLLERILNLEGQLSTERAALSRAEGDLARLRAALPDPSKLWALAEWIDLKYPDDANPEVQDDLRRWSRQIRALSRVWITVKEALPATSQPDAPSTEGEQP